MLSNRLQAPADDTSQSLTGAGSDASVKGVSPAPDPLAVQYTGKRVSPSLLFCRFQFAAGCAAPFLQAKKNRPQ
ncbi:hypothetical protein GTPT_1679 [Tatumella ptyseos ATCC 33301]|uniref:Uncharacterized protein n=1 Tax=Tatumella ptyseos ATCC 33301 TaxID=1005995 RepID=A0A085JH01_9GAMM|nr:hypothetical protein GTPT_1679 [Tatumella ptyseos ATCC 33301]